MVRSNESSVCAENQLDQFNRFDRKHYCLILFTGTSIRTNCDASRSSVVGGAALMI